MNTRPPIQHEALSQEELELARVVRALPGGEPPPALDATILKAASDAVASSQPPKKSLWRNGLLGTSALWLGTAAASVLTVGIGWQVFQSMRAPIYELPADENISTAQEIDESHKDVPLIVEMTPAREPLPTSPPPPEAFPETELAADAATTIASNENPKAIAPEKRKREEQVHQAMADEALAKKDNDKADMERYQAAEMAAAPQPQARVAAAPPAPPPALAGASTRDGESKELDSVNVTGSRLRRPEQISNAKITPREEVSTTSIDADAKLSPELWLYEIRDRVKRNDIDGAKASLKLFKETYPKRRIPEDLKPLLK